MLLKYDHYYTYPELTQAMHDLAAAYPELAKLEAIGTSPEGRSLWLMEITDRACGEACSKPAYYIDGNHHAGEVTGSMVALYAIDELLTRSEEPEFKQLLQQITFYILPRISVDGSEVYLTTPASMRSAPRPYPFVEKMPGLTAEDIDGDGHILLMRVPSPIGAWKADPNDPRLMLKRLPDDQGGTYYSIYQEGMIHEYDGHHIQQARALWGMDFNRNYPLEWGIESRQPGAGKYPLSEPETRAVAEFVLAHPNIGGVATLHTTGGVILRTPGTKPEKQSNPFDVTILKAIGLMASEETGYPSVNIYDEFLADSVNFSSGAFDDWCYASQGIPAYTVELWDLGLRAGLHMWPRKDKDDAESAEDYAKLLSWVDAELNGEGFIGWKPFNHPQLGPVEIGGFEGKFVVQNAPPQFLEQECIKNVRFFYRHARTLPRLSIEQPTVEKMDEGTWRISADVVNLSYLPTQLTAMANEIKVAKPITVSLCGADVIDGLAKREIPHLDGFSAVRNNFQTGGYRPSGVPKQKIHLTWIVQAVAGSEICISIQSQKAGNPSLKVVLA